jgi:general secretion pathway protein D
MKFIRKSLSKPLSIVVCCCTVLLLMMMSLTVLPHSSASESKKPDKVTFNFVDVDLTAVTKFISEITGKNFIFDEKVKGKITIIAPTKISIDEAYTLFTSVLDLKGFTVIPSGIEAYKIVPSIEARQRGLQISTEGMPLDESYIARLLPLKHISTEDALIFFQPLVSKEGHISVFGPGNLLLIVDSGMNIEKILSLIDYIDKPSSAEIPDVIRLNNASADTVARLINEGFTRARPATPRLPGQPAFSGGALAVADQRLNAVIIFGDQSTRESIKLLISAIDNPSPEALGRINVYFLENADATELAKVMEGMIRSLQTARQPAAAAPSAQVSPFEAAGNISITPDKATNSLLVVASPSDYQNIQHILKQLDKRRKQVFVEAMIIEASIDKLQELGTKWRVTGTRKGEPVIIGGVGKIDQNALQSIISGLSGMTLGGMGNFLDIPITSITDGTATGTTLKVPGFAALFSLSDFKDAVDILSTPQILTSDNKEAEIVVGENVPFISQRERDVTTTNTVLNSIERHDVGIKLRITPQITEGDYVKLDIYQEISSLKQDSQVILINIGPTTTKRSTKTSVVVKDNQTVVIGGLMQDRQEENITKIPLLGDIPVLGYLFKQKNISKNKTNLLVFLTPHIVKESDHLARLTEGKRKELGKATNQYAAGEVLVAFRSGVTANEALSIISLHDATVIAVIEEQNLFHIKLKQGQSVEESIKEFQAMPEVRFAEPNYMIRAK